MKTIGIIGAMPSELIDIRKALPDSEIQKKAGFDYYINTVGDTRIVHVCSSLHTSADRYISAGCDLECWYRRRHEPEHSRM